jgi:hypothetical protein
MPLQNRVLPDGSIVAILERGLFTGNRGIIHDPATRTLLSRRWTTKAWIVCVCDFKGRRREVMARRSWTELFFLDEATAFAAGHRPCFFCRRADAKRFQAAWAQGNRCDLPKVAIMDGVLHGERLDGKAKRLHPMAGPPENLPDGAMVKADGGHYMIAHGRTYRWTPCGYHREPVPADAQLVTPPSTVRALKAGYRPVLHPSLNAD